MMQGKNCLTSFYGMDFTTDKLRSIVRKWQTLIEAHVDVRTTDGYVLRLFSIGFTKRQFNQVKKTTYAQSSQVREIRAKMVEIMKREAEGSDLKELVQKFVPESIGREIEKACKVSFSTPNSDMRATVDRSGHLPSAQRLRQEGQDPQDAQAGHVQAARDPRRGHGRQHRLKGRQGRRLCRARDPRLGLKGTRVFWYF